jgi:trehalose 6-phosphate synthase
VRAGIFPLGIIREDFQERPDAAASEDVEALTRAIGGAKLVLGVDRLDYTKGIPERIAAFGRLLERYPEWRKKACLVQVSVPSRGDIPEYAEQRSRVENIVGRINGDFGEGDWVPIRYLYRSYGRPQLSELYRAADVGYVTPLRDGMNLVAKEFVAAQDPKRPGVLLLSRFAGAAEELFAALLTNPWYPDGTARDLDLALRMPAAERMERHAKLLEVISRTTALTWAEDFLSALAND